ncbi:hypothetical protein BANRA_05738 [Escherichia coli]|uniref:Uncharacterized protein n=1 Tax=Escherichia coli TaxID=562 RepID=A0A3P5HEK0_ECOLX|nr:hypothetical protein BANRA_05738 [Escherichia coli]
MFEVLLVSLLNYPFLCRGCILGRVLPVSQVICSLDSFRCSGQHFRRAVSGTTELSDAFRCQ